MRVLLSSARRRGRHPGVTGTNDKPTREERLAAKLRENLKRRKAQARAQRPDDTLPKKPERG